MNTWLEEAQASSSVDLTGSKAMTAATYSRPLAHGIRLDRSLPLEALVIDLSKPVPFSGCGAAANSDQPFLTFQAANPAASPTTSWLHLARAEALLGCSRQQTRSGRHKSGSMPPPFSDISATLAQPLL